MNLLDDIISVQISQTRDTIARTDFGTILILGDSIGGFNPRVQEFTSYTQVQAAFADGTPERKMAEQLFSQTFAPAKILIAQVLDEDGGSFVDAYNATKVIRTDFYLVLSTTRDGVTIVQLANQIETEKRIFGFASSQEEILTNAEGNIFGALANKKRSFGFYAGDDTKYLDAAIAGEMMPRDVGSADWAFKRLNGVTADNLTSTAIANIRARKGNFYSNLANVSCTFEGTTFDGNLIKTRMGIDWLEQTIKENIAALFISSPVVEYTQAGIDKIYNMVDSALKAAVNRGIIDTNYTISAPLITDVSGADKTAFTLRGVKFTATSTGAIHKVIITGEVIN